MKKVSDYLSEKLKKDPAFRERYDLIQQKARVAKKIIEYRLKNNISQTKLAEEIEVSQQYISKIEGGDFSNLATIEHILYHIGYRLRLEAVHV